MSNRDKMINKIRALMSKTIENGCTEAEMMAAISTAQAMMDAYEITDDDLKLEGEKAEYLESNMKDPRNVRYQLAYMIAKFTNTKIWQSGQNKNVMKFVGLQSDIEFAKWLLEALTMFVHVELKNYMWANRYQSLQGSQRYQVANSFCRGCVSRINQRIGEIVFASKANENKNALVVTIKALIDDKVKDLGLTFVEGRARTAHVVGDYYDAGKAAGDRASFGRPVGGAAGMLRLGSR